MCDGTCTAVLYHGTYPSPQQSTTYHHQVNPQHDHRKWMLLLFRLPRGNCRFRNKTMHVKYTHAYDLKWCCYSVHGLDGDTRFNIKRHRRTNHKIIFDMPEPSYVLVPKHIVYSLTSKKKTIQKSPISCGEFLSKNEMPVGVGGLRTCVPKGKLVARSRWGQLDFFSTTNPLPNEARIVNGSSGMMRAVTPAATAPAGLDFVHKTFRTIYTDDICCAPYAQYGKIESNFVSKYYGKIIPRLHC